MDAEKKQKTHPDQTRQLAYNMGAPCVCVIEGRITSAFLQVPAGDIGMVMMSEMRNIRSNVIHQKHYELYISIKHEAPYCKPHSRFHTAS